MIFKIIGKVPSKSSSRIIIKNKKTGRPFIISSAVCRQYEKDFASQVTSRMKNCFEEKDRLRVFIYWWTDSYRQDIDAPAKVIFDCMQKNGIIVNDNKIDYYSIIRLIDKKNPRIGVEVLKKGKHRTMICDERGRLIANEKG